MTKKRLIAEIVKLENRVKELEDRLCPCESHDWKQIDYTFEVISGLGDTATKYTYKCKTCGKVLKTWRTL